MYKVFINDKPLYITSQKKISQLSEKNILKLHYKSEKEIQAALDALSPDADYPGAILYAEDEKNLWEKFCAHFEVLEAAGGLVSNGSKELLMIYRFEKWDLPKGKIENNEKPDEAALREVCEETGVCDCEIVKELTQTFHTYYHKRNNILKKTFWFEMNCKSFHSFKVQHEEGIAEAKWMNKIQLENAVKNTYPSIRELIKMYL
jgi:8-oxo-dGTP pyrophosphatase MutT (NUDIX family)